MSDDGAGRQPTARVPPAQAARAGRSFDRARDPVEFGRIVALTDGVFAIALTLLVLDLALPADAGDVPLASALAARIPQFIAFVISVAVVGTFFQSHHALVRRLQAFDTTLLGLTIPYLGLVALVPFVQSLLGAGDGEPLALTLYAMVLGFGWTVEGVMLWHAHRRGLLRHPLRGRVARFEAVRAVLPPVVFFASAGLALLIGAWTILVWLALWPLDGLLGRWQTRDGA